VFFAHLFRFQKSQLLEFDKIRGFCQRFLRTAIDNFNWKYSKSYSRVVLSFLYIDNLEHNSSMVPLEAPGAKTVNDTIVAPRMKSRN
jgi:hypothetical protein